MGLSLGLCVLLASCGGYADFSLPRTENPAQAAAYRFESHPDPLIGRGVAGEWDSVDVLNPSVVKSGNIYFNLYSGFDGQTWHTGLATSADGLHWEKRGKVLSPRKDTWEGHYIAANGSLLWKDDEFLYWYHAGPREKPRLGLARSADAVEWERRSEPVLLTGPRGSWDERGVADPYVIHTGDSLYMYYLGQDRARRQRLGVARSRDGVRWEKLRANPILELGEAGGFDELGLGEPAVWASDGFYWMLYTGRDRREHRRLGLARSEDGVHWRKLGLALAGREEWNGKVVCDPSVLMENGRIRVWYGGGAAPSPDENLKGQIGLAEASMLR
ncbi:MAG: hypothetical protein WD696_08310 [Bryobacteraceae bacterium]